MAAKIVLFSEISVKFPAISSLAAGSSAEVVSIGGGRDVLALSLDPPPAVIILDIAMPQMSGIECCRQLRERGLEIPVVLVSDIDSAAIEERAVGAGCTLFVGPRTEEAVWHSFLRPLLVGNPPPRRSVPQSQTLAIPDEVRRGKRRAIRRPMLFLLNGEKHAGELVNMSLSGLLFLTHQEVEAKTALTVGFLGDAGEKLKFPVRVVRIMRREKVGEHYAFAVGAEFADLSPKEREELDVVLGEKEGTDLPPVTTEFAAKALEATEEWVRTTLQAEEPGKAAIGPFLGELSEFEKLSLEQESPTAACARRLLLHRLQCRVFRAFLPTLSRQSGTLLPAFLPRAELLLKALDAIEAETEELVRQAVASNDEASRQGLNESSNRLHEVKMTLFFAVSDTLPAEGVGSNAEVLRDIRQRVERLRALQKSKPDDLKYARRPSAPPPRAVKQKDTTLLHSTKFWVLAGITLLIAVGSLISTLIFARVSPQKFGFPSSLVVRKVVVEELGLDVHLERASWSGLTPVDRKAAMDKVEAYLRERRMLQAKFLDEEGRLLAAIMGGRMGKAIQYTRR